MTYSPVKIHANSHKFKLAEELTTWGIALTHSRIGRKKLFFFFFVQIN